MTSGGRVAMAAAMALGAVVLGLLGAAPTTAGAATAAQTTAGATTAGPTTAAVIDTDRVVGVPQGEVDPLPALVGPGATAARTVKSGNWSGYADTKATFTAVTGTWAVPTVTCTNRDAYSAEWVGIDGYSSNSVEQDGVEADCLSGSPSYDAWFEMYGDRALAHGDELELRPATFPVDPGDPVTASVSVAAGTWTLSLVDAAPGHGWQFSTTVTFAGAAQSSAEWVVERPELCDPTCALTSLADFGTASLTAAAVTTGGSAGPIDAGTDTAMDMVRGKTLIAEPSALDPAGDSFTDTWLGA